VAAARKLKRGHHPTQVWIGLGMMGLIGWSVALPTLLGAALGLWLDKRYVGAHSWTFGAARCRARDRCANAWHWVVKEDKAMHEDRDE